MREKGYTVIKKIMQRKMRIHWQSDEGLVQKVWIFDERSIEAYGRERVEHELVELFPLLKVSDLKSALTAFSEEEDLSLLHLHASPRGLVLPF